MAFHVAGVLIYANPEKLHDVARAIAALDGVVVHAHAGNGKLVATLESDGPHQIVDNIDAIQRTRGVVSAVLVYEHHEALSASDEEMAHGA